MAKIVSMSSGAIDPIAQTKRVFWRPYVTTIVLKPGDAVCYRLDAEDHKKRIVDPTHLGLVQDTYAEGEQEMTSRLFCVEEPLIDNIDQFAGIVKSLGPKAGADGDMIEIFKANSGAVVPANVVLTATVTGRTLLAVMVDTRTLGSPTSDIPNFGITAGSIDSKVVGIAMEELSAAGKCWVKLDENQFIHQGGQIGQEFQVAAGAVNVTVNQMNVQFANTAGNCQMLHYRAVLSVGGAICARGVYRFETFLKGAHTNQANYGLVNHVDLSTGYENVGGHIIGLASTVRSRGINPDLSGALVYAFKSEIILTKDGPAALDDPPDVITHFYLNSDSTGTTPNYFLVAPDVKHVPLEANAKVKRTVCALSMTIRVGGTPYHIPCYTLAELTTDTGA